MKLSRKLVFLLAGIWLLFGTSQSAAARNELAGCYWYEACMQWGSSCCVGENAAHTCEEYCDSCFLADGCAGGSCTYSNELGQHEGTACYCGLCPK